MGLADPSPRMLHDSAAWLPLISRDSVANACTDRQTLGHAQSIFLSEARSLTHLALGPLVAPPLACAAR
jgi:hypothetical protein